MKRTALLLLSSAAALSSTVTAQVPQPVKADTPAEALASIPNLNTLIASPTSEMAPVWARLLETGQSDLPVTIFHLNVA